MMKQKRKIAAIIAGISLLGALAAFAVWVAAPFGIAAIQEGSGGKGLFDLKFSFTPDMIMTAFSRYEGDRYGEYLTYYIVDTVMLILRTVFLVAFPVWINTFSDKHYLLYRTAIFSAAFSGFFDLVENCLLFKMIKVYPVFTDTDVNVASGSTTLKWVFLALWCVAAVLFALATAVTVKTQSKGRYSR